MKKSAMGLLILAFCLAINVHGDALDNWTVVGKSTNGAFIQIVYGNGMFAAVSDLPFEFPNGGGGLSTSSDTVHWVHTPLANEPSGIAFGNGVFVRTEWVTFDDGETGEIYCASNAAALTNASNQTVINNDFPNNIFTGLFGVTFGTNSNGRGTFVAVGHDYQDDVDILATSTNGFNWTLQASPETGEFLTGIAFNGAASETRFIAVGYNPYESEPQSASMLWSADNVTWHFDGLKQTQLPFLPQFISCVNGTCYVSDNSTNVFFARTNDIAFSRTNSPYPSLWTPLGSATGTYVSINSGSNLYTSTNGLDWRLRNTGITNKLTCIAFGGNYFVVGTADGTLLRSGSIAAALAVKADPATDAPLVNVTGGLFSTVTLQASTNVLSWTNLVTLTNNGGANQYLDLATKKFTPRYYRAISQ